MGINSYKDYSSLFGTEASPEDKTSSKQEVKQHRCKNSKRSSSQANKRLRVRVDENGKTRRPVNITMTDETKLAFDILAVKKRVKVWELVEEALLFYLNEHEDK